jgi:hypothetical protein
MHAVSAGAPGTERARGTILMADSEVTVIPD